MKRSSGTGCSSQPAEMKTLKDDDEEKFLVETSRTKSFNCITIILTFSKLFFVLFFVNNTDPIICC